MKRVYEPQLASEKVNTRCTIICRTNTERHLVVALIKVSLMAVILFITSIMLNIMYVEAQNKGQDLEASSSSTHRSAETFTRMPSTAPSNVCNSAECVLSAAALLEAMDRSVDPCQDFYQYSCGLWNEHHPRPSSEGSWSSFNEVAHLVTTRLIQELKNPPSSEQFNDPYNTLAKTYRIFTACSNTTARDSTGLTPLLEVLDGIGGWPMMNSSWLVGNRSYSWEHITDRVILATGGSSLVALQIVLDNGNTSRYLVQIDQPTSMIPREILLDSSTFADVHSAYIQLMVEVAEDVLLSSHNVTVTSEQKQQLRVDATEVLSLTIAIAQISQSSEDRRDPVRMYNLMTLSQLQSTTDQMSPDSINWRVLIGKLLSLGDNSSVVDGDMEIVVVEQEFIVNLAQLLSAASRKTIANYVAWDVILSSGSELTSHLSEIFFSFTHILSGSQVDASVEESCAIWLSGAMQDAVDHIYIHKYFTKAEKQKVEEMVSDIRRAFGDELETVPWMDENTRSNAILKADKMSKHLAYSEKAINFTNLSDKFQSLAVTELHYDNVISLNRLSTAETVSKLSKPVDRDQFLMASTSVNAMYDTAFNSITFPAGILQPPFFKHGLPVLDYASIGSVIGHEITHGFDDYGQQFGWNGVLLNWWSKATAYQFQRRAQCMVDQYSSFSLPELQNLMNDTHVNGKATEGENIADNGGIRQAYRAFFTIRQNRTASSFQQLPGLADFSPEQLFFLAFANMWCDSNTPESMRSRLMSDEHSPHRFRVLGTLMNTPEFSDAYQCPQNSPMNPTQRCRIW